MNDNTSSGDREIVITRVFDAPRDLVFSAWTDPDHVGEWWGPNGFTITTHEMDVRPGGVWRFIMHGPDGVDYNNRIDYLEVIRPEQLVYAHGDGSDDGSPGFHTTVSFADRDGGTEVVMRAIFASAGERAKAVREVGAIEGGNQTLDRFGEYLRTM